MLEIQLDLLTLPAEVWPQLNNLAYFLFKLFSITFRILVRHQEFNSDLPNGVSKANLSATAAEEVA